MPLFRCLVPALLGGLLGVAQLGAQQPRGSITGRVVDGATQQPIAGVSVVVMGTERRALTRNDGSFTLSEVPAGAQRLRATRIGYGPGLQETSVMAGGTVTVQFALQPQAAVLEEVVVTGYGTQRRESITGSVATVNPEAANVGVKPNLNELIQGRAAGVTVTPNTGEPGAGLQIRIRGGTSISATNEPLYVIDGVPIQNAQSEPGGTDIAAGMARNPLNLLNPADIASITILKDAAAAAIYGSRAANGVILIETKKGGAGGGATMEYDGYVAMANQAAYLDVLNGDQYRQFVQDQVAAGNLSATRLAGLDSANTNWERAVARTAVTHNHNLSFAGGTAETRYRASLNYLNQQGVVLSSGLERVQGRLNATHQTFDDRLRLGVNVMASHVTNDYLPFETGPGFEGGVFQNVAVFNPTHPIKVVDPATGQETYYEIGTGRQSVRNPVALTDQIADFGSTIRTLGNASAELDLFSGLTAQVNLGGDLTSAVRRTYFPNASPIGAEWGGRALQKSLDNESVTLQTLLTFRRQLGTGNDLDMVGGYEFSKYRNEEFGAEGRGYISDALGFNSLGGAKIVIPPYSYRNDRRFVAVFSRANYTFKDRYALTGVLRYDGASQFGEGKKWALFPAVSASWRLSEEGFLSGGPFSDLRLRAGWGLQGNPGVPPYASLIRLEPSGGARYIFGEAAVTGVAPVSNANPDLKWEQTSQTNVALDFGILDNKLSGTVEYYVKNTSDLILEVPVPQPAAVSTRLENVGKVRNRGLEVTLETVPVSRQNVTLRAGLVFAAERNTVVDLGPYNFINTGNVTGQGQSGQVSERILPGYPTGTFYGPEFTRVCGAGESSCTQGQQVFNKYQTERDAKGRIISQTLAGETSSPTGDDYVVIGNANPDFTFGFRGRGDVGKFDFSFLIRSQVGGDVFNNTALVYSTKGNALQDKNFLVSALDDPTGIREPAIFSSRWIEDGTFVRLQNFTVGVTFQPPEFLGRARSARFYVSGDNLLLLTGYSGYDPEVHTDAGLAARGIDNLSYPRARTVLAGLQLAF